MCEVFDTITLQASMCEQRMPNSGGGIPRSNRGEILRKYLFHYDTV